MQKSLTWFCRLLLLLAALAAHADDVVLRVGDAKGMYRALLDAAGESANLAYRIEWAEFPATAPALEALWAGAIDLRCSAAAPLIFALSSGAPLKAVAALRLDGPRESVAILVVPDSPIREVTDLRGRRIGTNKGSVGHHLVLAALERAHMPFDVVSIQFLMPADAKAAVLSGSIDAWSTWDPYVSIAETEDHLRPVVDGTNLPITDTVIVTSAAAIGSKRAQLRDFLARFARAQGWATAHPDEYGRIYAALTGLPPAVTRLIVKHTAYRFQAINGEVVREHQQVADLYYHAGVIRRPVEVSAAFDDTLVPGSAPVSTAAGRRSPR